MKKKCCCVVSVLLAVVFLFGSFSAAAAEEKPLYVVLGDSIAFGSGLLNPQQAVYGRIVADTDGFDYENYAIPGHTTGDLLRRMQNQKVHAAIEAADVISISIGGNNFLRGDLLGILYNGVVKNNYAPVEQIVAPFVADLDTIVTEIHTLNPDAAIVLQTIYNPQSGYAGEVYGHGAAILNDAIKAYVQAHPDNVYLVDVAARLTDHKADFARDGIHPSAVGNEKIAKAVLETLFENGLGAKTEPVIAVKGQDVFGTDWLAFSVTFYCWALHLVAPLLSKLPV